MAALSSFHPLIAPFVPGAPDPAIENAALQGAIEFCQRTLTLQRTLASVPTVIDQTTYTLVQAGEVVAKLLGVKLAGKPLDLLTPTDLDGENTPTMSVVAPDAAILTGPMTLQLDPPPAAASLGIVVRAAMRPAQAATTVDDGVFERHARAIADFACYWLMCQPETTYYNKGAAEIRFNAFETAVGKEKARVLRSHSRARSRPGVLWL